MDKKLRILMQNENLTASRLAEILEIKPAAVSHILSGRNKPSFELICKIVNRFPQVNPYWLLGDAEEMLNQNAPIPTLEDQSSANGMLFDFTEGTTEKCEEPKLASQAALPQIGCSNIEKIIIVYRDKTFEELRPKNL